PLAIRCAAYARSRLPPKANVRPARRNYRGGPLVPASALQPRSPPTCFPFRLPVLRSRALRRHRLPAPAMPCGPASRWTSTVTTPAAHPPPVPCPPASSPISARAALRPLPLHPSPLHRCSRPPIACLRLPPPAPPPPLPVSLRAPPAALRSLPARS